MEVGTDAEAEGVGGGDFICSHSLLLPTSLPPPLAGGVGRKRSSRKRAGAHSFE